ncbi:MAG TPA: methyltransferase [Kribbellaceae bacterium]|nr:methyltransferase [Kribbellaceae bacterium]
MADPTDYTPTVPAERAERIRDWHERAYQATKAEGQRPQTFEYLGRTIVVPPNVMPITGMSHLLGEAVLAEVRPTDRVLDMGTGSGVNAILAASVSSDVLAVDINPYALTAARDNAIRNGVADRIVVRHSDVFSAVDGTFDLIVFDPPFRWFAPRDILEAATADEDYRALTTFVRSGRWYLAPGGRILVFFGTSGDLGYLKRLVAEQGFQTEILARQTIAKDGMEVEYVTYRLSR